MKDHARILIVEDEPLIAADLAAMLAELGHEACGLAGDATTAISKARDTRPDLALLDIRLSGAGDGVAVAEAFATEGIPFLYVTSHTDPATMARVAATRPEGFIIKPFDLEDLRTQITVALSRLAGAADLNAERSGGLLVRDHGRWIRVPLDLILYAEADDNYTMVHTASRRFALVSSLSAVEEKVAGRLLLRVHRKYMVNIQAVSASDPGHVYLGTLCIPVGRTYREEVMRRLKGA